MACRLRPAVLSCLGLCSLAAPTFLRTEWAVNPIQVDNPAPRFSWDVPGPQTAYRIVVSTSTSSIAVWDSSNVSSPSTSGVIYSGEPLLSDTDYTWTVASADINGTWTESTAAYFSTALFNQKDWSGDWIGGANQLASNFSLQPSPIVRARLYVTAVGCYELWINGQHVSRGGVNGSEPPSFINPGFRCGMSASAANVVSCASPMRTPCARRSTIYSTRLLYNAYDVATLLFPGAVNEVGLRLGSCKFGYLGEFCSGGNASLWWVG